MCGDKILRGACLVCESQGRSAPHTLILSLRGRVWIGVSLRRLGLEPDRREQDWMEGVLVLLSLSLLVSVLLRLSVFLVLSLSLSLCLSFSLSLSFSLPPSLCVSLPTAGVLCDTGAFEQRDQRGARRTQVDCIRPRSTPRGNPYKHTSLIRNSPPFRTTIGP